MAAWNLPCEVASWIVQMAYVLDRRIAWRLLPLLVARREPHSSPLVNQILGQGAQEVCLPRTRFAERQQVLLAIHEIPGQQAA